MQDKQIPTVHCSGQPNHLPKTAGELKASLYDNHPWYYSHNDDDGDLQMSLSLCVRVCACVCACASALASLPSWVHYYSGRSSHGGAPTAADKTQRRALD